MGTVVSIIGFLLLAGFMAMVWHASEQAEERLADPEDLTVVYLDQVPALAQLSGDGPWYIQIRRQSGNVHSERLAENATDAIKMAVSTFRRAKIDAVGFHENTGSVLHFQRLHWGHRGSNEGKKVGSAIIVKAD